MNSDLSKEDIFGQSENELLTENFLDNNEKEKVYKPSRRKEE